MAVVSAPGLSLRERLEADPRLRPRIVDAAFYVLIFLLGAFQFTHYPHSTDFLSDVSYPDLGRSLLEHGTYEIRNLPQTTLPPGLAFILAAVGKFFGITPAVAFRVIAVATFLGVIACYEFLKRAESQGLAFVACILFASSPSLFGFNTTVVYPEMPYLLASMIVLLLARKIDNGVRGPTKILLIVALGAALASAVLIRSVGVALLAGLVASILGSFVFAREKGRRRLALFIFPLALGVAAQATWSSWAHHHAILEWQLPGYPESYVSQLKVKDGQYPELGFASARDIPTRVARNIVARASGISVLLIRRNVAQFWSSPLISGLILLLVLGLISSIRDGGQLADWYFIFYEAIFLVWPWDYRDRFTFPILPLVCLYTWRGLKFLRVLLFREPRLVTVALALMGTVLSVASAGFAFGRLRFQANPEHIRGDHIQTVITALFWAAVAITALLLFVLHRREREGFLLGVERAFRPELRLAAGFVGCLTLAYLVTSASRNILADGRNNLHPTVSMEGLYPEIKVSDWIRTHEPAGSIIMAREPEFVFHYSHDQTVWFPPISDPATLMDGIHRHGVDIIEVAKHPESYWSPPEDVCFEKLLKAYGRNFRLDHQDTDYLVYAVVNKARPSSARTTP